MSETKDITGSIVTKVDRKEKLSIITVKKGGREMVVKGWNDHPLLSLLSEGVVITNTTKVEVKDGKYGAEHWLVAEKKPGGGGRGPAKSDPVKNDIIKTANQNNNETMQKASAGKTAVAMYEMAFQSLNDRRTITGEEYTNADVQAMAIDLWKGCDNLADIILGRFNK